MDGDKHIIFFDGVCNLCNFWVDFVISRDTAALFLFAPLQGETALGLQVVSPFVASPVASSVPGQSPDFSDSQKLDSIILRLSSGLQLSRSDAVLKILSLLGGWWAFFSVLMRIFPRPLRDMAYLIIARYRYLLFGKKDSCRLPTKEEARRFLP